MTYEEAVHVTTQAEADRCFEKLLYEILNWEFPPVPIKRAEAVSIAQKNLLWASKNYDEKVQERVKRLYRIGDK